MHVLKALADLEMLLEVGNTDILQKALLILQKWYRERFFP